MLLLLRTRRILNWRDPRHQITFHLPAGLPQNSRDGESPALSKLLKVCKNLLIAPVIRNPFTAMMSLENDH